LTNQNGFGSFFLRKIAQSAGVSVNATIPEITTEITMVMAYYSYQL
jgi:hypothetical protein